MSTYGRNLDFRTFPVGAQRAARYSVEEETVIGTPVVITGDKDSHGRLIVELAAEGADIPDVGLGGLMVFEAGPDAFRDMDRNLYNYSDIGTAPAGKAVQVVNGNQVKIVLKNTAARTFLNTRQYAGRKMVAGVGATPSIAIGDYLCPGVGTDTDGYWKKTTDPTKAWLVVTDVDSDRDEVEARLNF